MNNVLEKKSVFGSLCLLFCGVDKRKLILRWKEKIRKRLKGGETCTCFLLNLFSSPKTKK